MASFSDPIAAIKLRQHYFQSGAVQQAIFQKTANWLLDQVYSVKKELLEKENIPIDEIISIIVKSSAFSSE